MAGRTVEIKFTGDNFAECVGDFLAGKKVGEETAERINALPDDNVEFIKEELTAMSGRERQQIYEWLNTVFRCRM